MQQLFRIRDRVRLRRKLFRQLRQAVRAGYDPLSRRLSVEQRVVEFFGDFGVSRRDGVFPGCWIEIKVNLINIKAVFPVVFHLILSLSSNSNPVNCKVP